MAKKTQIVHHRKLQILQVPKVPIIHLTKSKDSNSVSSKTTSITVSKGTNYAPSINKSTPPKLSPLDGNPNAVFANNSVESNDNPLYIHSIGTSIQILLDENTDDLPIHINTISADN